MHIKRISIAVLLISATTFFLVNCNSYSTINGDKKSNNNDTIITPKELPEVVPGFKFPEDSTTIYGWMNDKNFPNNYDSAKVYSHAWGVWAGLTSSSGEVFQGDSLSVFETWLGISEIQTLTGANIINGGCDITATKNQRTPLERPRQFGHGPTAALKLAMMYKQKDVDTIDVNPSFWVTVSYDPNAACYATSNSILRQSVQNKYAVKDGIGNIPAFPTKSVTIKPVYFAGSATDSLIQIPVWSGPKDTAYPSNSWPKVVYADVHNRQVPNKALVPANTSDRNSAHIKAATCNLNDFIHFKVDAKMAVYMNKQDSSEGFNSQHENKPAIAGQMAILVAMHVTTKEIANWTWQTYYWAPDPMHPNKPSSDLAASLLPTKLKGTVAGHYAVVTGYAMVMPNQPLIGGTNKGVTPIFGYNPYLESSFDTSLRGGNLVFPNKLNKKFLYGSTTNCMTCHSLATPTSIITYNDTAYHIYSTAQYISNADTFFKNKVRLDFAWSIQGNTINDVTPAKKTK